MQQKQKSQILDDPTANVAEGDDDEDALERQCAALREAPAGNQMRKQRPTGVKNCLFVTVPGSDPTDLSARMVDLCHEESHCRFLDRVIPVSRTENVDLVKLNEMVFEMVRKHLDPSLSSVPTYALEFKARNNDSVKRQSVLEMLNDAVTALCPSARVNLSDPDATFFVQVVRKTLMVGVALGYQRRRRFNLRKLEENNEKKLAEAEGRPEESRDDEEDHADAMSEKGGTESGGEDATAEELETPDDSQEVPVPSKRRNPDPRNERTFMITCRKGAPEHVAENI